MLALYMYSTHHTCQDQPWYSFAVVALRVLKIHSNSIISLKNVQRYIERKNQVDRITIIELAP